MCGHTRTRPAFLQRLVNVIVNGDRGAARGGRRVHFDVVHVQRLAHEEPDELQGAGLVCGIVMEIIVFVGHLNVPSGWSSGLAVMISSPDG